MDEKSELKHCHMIAQSYAQAWDDFLRHKTDEAARHLAEVIASERKAAYDEGFSEGYGCGANSIMACNHE